MYLTVPGQGFYPIYYYYICNYFHATGNPGSGNTSLCQLVPVGRHVVWLGLGQVWG